MKHNKLIQLLSHLDKTEVKQFELFLESPFFNTSKKLLTFYKILLKYYPDFKSPMIDSERLYRSLHRGSEYNAQTMRELYSELLKLLREFISHQQLKNQPIDASQLRYSWLEAREIQKMCEQEIMLRDALLSDPGQKDYTYYYQKWVLDHAAFEHSLTVLRDMEHKLLKKNDLDHHIHSLNKYYLVSFFKSLVSLMGMSKIYGYQLDSSLLTYVDALAPRYVGQGDHLIDSHYYIWQIQATGEERYYFALKSGVMTAKNSLPREVLGNTSIVLENYCIQQLRAGDMRFVPELMEIFRFEIEHELMIENGEVSYSFYMQVITMGIDSGEPEWLNDFKEKYKNKLPAKYGEHVYNFCEAYILFAHGKYEEALRITSKLNPYNDFHKIDIKRFVARIQYELGMFDQLDVLIESYHYHLNAKPIPELRKQNHLVFISNLTGMVNLQRQFNHEAWEKLMSEIGQLPVSPQQTWFVGKMNEIAEGRRRG